MKDNLDDALTMPFLAALDNEAARLIDSAADPDHREAVSAFAERREPSFYPVGEGEGPLGLNHTILKNLSGRDPPSFGPNIRGPGTRHRRPRDAGETSENHNTPNQDQIDRPQLEE